MFNVMTAAESFGLGIWIIEWLCLMRKQKFCLRVMTGRPSSRKIRSVSNVYKVTLHHRNFTSALFVAEFGWFDCSWTSRENQAECLGGGKRDGLSLLQLTSTPKIQILMLERMLSPRRSEEPLLGIPSIWTSPWAVIIIWHGKKCSQKGKNN